ncbi:MAG TPA: hypothetical protein PKC45_04440 [Gemmatales bacterium]|nr:hypothetical protein [Gemmatales bacterium]
MPRRFVNVAEVRDPGEILSKVRNWVRLLRCGEVIPVVYFSKKVGKDYFVFLGYESFADNSVPSELRELCEKAGFNSRMLDRPLAFEELKKFLDPQEFDTTGSDRIPYRARWVGDSGDVFDLAEAAGEAPAAASDTESDARYDRLLAWLTATGEGRWESFVKACAVIGVADNNTSAKAVFRRLSLLGHIEASDDARQWVVSPLVFVRTACDPSVSFWCGQRTFAWRESLSAALATDVQSQPSSQAPPRIAVRESDVDKMYRSLKALDNPFEWQEGSLALVLAGNLPDLDHWEASLPVLSGLVNPEHAERWEGSGYVEDSGFHIRDGRYNGASGLYRVTRGEGRHRTQLTFYLDQERQVVRRGDWYGLRFLALRRAGRRCSACWTDDASGGKLILRGQERWPALYERALVLASGLLPSQSANGLLHYSGIPLELAHALTKRLGVELEQ